MNKIPFYSAVWKDRKEGDQPRIYGYYVFCRNRHYILQAYNAGGYDERWEAHEWLEIEKGTLQEEDFKEFFGKEPFIN